MFIRIVDESLQRWLRSELPMPAEVGDITFDQPASSWSAKLSRLTVNLFLYDVTRSTQVARSLTQRLDENGRAQRRAPQPMIRLGYLVSAWAGSTRDEHQLLGEVVSLVAGSPTLPLTDLAVEAQSSVSLVVGDDDHNRPREIWSSLGGQLKASFTLQATVAADTFSWREEAPAVRTIEALTAPVPMPT